MICLGPPSLYITSPEETARGASITRTSWKGERAREILGDGKQQEFLYERKHGEHGANNEKNQVFSYLLVQHDFVIRDTIHILFLAILRDRDLFGMVSSRDPNSKANRDLQLQDQKVTN